MQGCLPNTLKYFLFFLNLVVFVLGLVCLGFSLYAYFDEASFSHLVETGASEIEGKKIPFNVFKTSSLLLIIASTIIVVISFFGCLGTYKENRFLLYLYFFCLLVMFLLITMGATIVTFQSIELLKEPLLESLNKYDPGSADEDILELTRSWDDVQKEFSCCGVSNYKDWQNQTYIIEQDDGKVPNSCCFNVNNITQCLNNPGDQEFEDHMDGCLDTFAKSIEGNKDIVVTVSGGMILGMFFNLVLLFGFALCLMPQYDPGYEQV